VCFPDEERGTCFGGITTPSSNLQRQLILALCGVKAWRDRIKSDLKSQYSQLSDSELLSMTYLESSDYTEEAIKVAKSILDERGLSNPSNEILQQTENYQPQIEDEEKDECAKAIKSKDMFRFRKFMQALKEDDYGYVAKFSFWFVLCYSCYSGLTVGNGKGKFVSLFGPLKSEYLLVIEVICSIAVFGIFPVIYFIIHSMKLSPDQRKQQGLSLLMPKYIFIIYGISLFLLIAPFILGSLGW
jgi:hypothetical protein